MKIFIDWLKKAITKVEHDNELYVGNQFSNKFDVYFYNVGTDTDWFPTLTQLAPNGREAGPFTPDSDSFTTTTIDNVTYLTATFTMGTGYAFIKGVSSFFLYENRITTPHPTKSVIGKFIVTLNNSDNGYFIDDPEFNPKVKEYVDKYSQLRFGGEASTSVIEALDSNQGVWLATDTGYYWYWDYDNNEYVRGNLFQAVSVADNGITTQKIADGAITKNKLATAVRNEIDNKVNNGENNDDGSISTETVIRNTTANQEDTDGTYGSEVRLNYGKGKLSTFEMAGTTEREAKVETEDALGEGYRVLIEVNDDDEYISKIKVLKDLIELLSGGKLTLTAKTGVAITSGDDTNQVEGDINIETKYGGITIETDTDHELTIISGGGINLRDDTYIVNSNLHVDREIYEGNKRIATKEYVLQREAYLQQQIDDIEIQTNVVKQSDIVDNLTTDDSTKVLSAAQGKILKGFIDNINTLLQCDDTTLDEIQEIVDYIKNNKSLIDGITTSKVSVSDIINNLTTTATNKPLSANQGKVLKGLIDGLQTSINAIKNGTNINSFGAVETALGDLDGRVSDLEENPTSNVSGTNDGTNWTTITIGNETYAIPSGSSSGGSGETLKIIEFTPNDMDSTLTTSEVGYAKIRVVMKGTDYNALLQQLGMSEAELITAFNSANAFYQTQYITNILENPANMYTCVAELNEDGNGEFRPYMMKSVGGDFDNYTQLSYAVYPLASSFDVNNCARKGNTLYILRYGINYPTTATVTITTIGGGNGGSSASSGAYYEIKTSDIAFYDENGNQITSDVLTNLKITMSEGQFEALKVKMGLPSSATINDLLTQVNSTFTETSASASNTAYQGLVALSGYCQFWFMENYVYHELAMMSAGLGLADLGSNNLYGWFTSVNDNEIPMGISATWTLSQYGTSGGSSSSESYYKIVLEDFGRGISDTKLIVFIYKEDLTPILTAINTQMGTNLQTASDLVTAYDTLKLDSNNATLIATLFTEMARLSISNNLNNLVVGVNDVDSSKKIVDTIFAEIICGSDVKVFDLSGDNGANFTSSTLTITEQNNQKI